MGVIHVSVHGDNIIRAITVSRNKVSINKSIVHSANCPSSWNIFAPSIELSNVTTDVGHVLILVF